MELSLDATNEAVDWVGSLLAFTNYTIDICVDEYIQQSEDKDVKPNWENTIRLYLPCDLYVNARREEIENLLSPLQRTGMSAPVEISVVEEKATHPEVLNSTVRRIGQRFVVLSPDISYTAEAADDITLRLKSSYAFGSGLHPATMLAAELLEKHVVPAMNVLDLGSGSGILSVAMAKLGARVLALDNDSIAVESTQDAVERNGVKQQVTVMEGSLGRGSDLGHWMGGETVNNVPSVKATGTFDLIVANILARVHVNLASDYRRALRCTDAQGGLLIASGFTDDYEEHITASLQEKGFEVVDCARFNEWVALAFRLK
jgi:ribosomal protein L11 methyltransferase